MDWVGEYIAKRIKQCKLNKINEDLWFKWSANWPRPESTIREYIDFIIWDEIVGESFLTDDFVRENVHRFNKQAWRNFFNRFSSYKTKKEFKQYYIKAFGREPDND